MRLTLGMLLCLSGCVITTQPPPVKTVEPAKIEAQALPQTVWPDTCVADWYAKEKLPPCVENWITEVTTQQKKIEEKKQQLKRKPKKHHTASRSLVAPNPIQH